MNRTDHRTPRRPPEGLFYERGFVSTAERTRILAFLDSLVPIWEQRFSDSNPPPPDDRQRWLLRPVYWLGNWQFACLNYYHPPRGTLNRCVEAEPFPPVLAHLCRRIETLVKRIFPRTDVPSGWQLNTCLINYYGNKLVDGKWEDRARVGEHRDYEPGPVASISLGERALFQFVETQGRKSLPRVVFQQWLEDRSLQIFGGRTCKDKLFHRVQRVEKMGLSLGPYLPEFETRRINFTFRFVPRRDWVTFKNLPAEKRADTLGYMQQLAAHSLFFRSQVP